MFAMTEVPARHVPGDFDLVGLYAALNAEREARELSWAALMAEINTPFRHLPSRPIATSTVRSMPARPTVTSAVVLQVLRWLGRTPESFLPGTASTARATRLPDAGTSQVLRVDTRLLFAALDERRAARGLTWKQVARDLRCGQGQLTNLVSGPLIGVPQLTRITQWLGEPVARFVRAYDW
jgi:hypothetical protein